MISVGAVIRNEAKHIVGMLENVRAYTNDIVIIDQASTDDTAELVQKWSKGWKGTINWMDAKPKGYGDPDRTLLLASGKYDWMLMMDADERIPEGVPFDDLAGYAYEAVNLPMRSLYFEPDSGYERWSYAQLLRDGREVNEGYPDYHPRFLRKGTVWPADVHDRPRFRRIYNANEYDMLHLKTYEGQMAKNRKYVELFPEWRERLDGHCRYVQRALGKPERGLDL